MTSLTPKLTDLDKQVAAQLPAGQPGRSAAGIADRVARGRADAQLQHDVLLILRGLEHLGRAHNRNGWWTA